jgi:hypothetical protein
LNTVRSSLSVALGPSDRLVLSAMTNRAALSAPVRTVSSRSMLSPTLICVAAEAATRTTWSWMTTASPTRVCACASGVAHTIAINDAGRSTRRRRFIS